MTLGTILLPGCSSSTEKKGDTGMPTVKQEPATENSSAGNSLGAIGFQLYSVKDVIEDDLKGTLQTAGRHRIHGSRSVSGKKRPLFWHGA